jgi:hypothetical protein
MNDPERVAQRWAHYLSVDRQSWIPLMCLLVAREDLVDEHGQQIPYVARRRAAWQARQAILTAMYGK